MGEPITNRVSQKIIAEAAARAQQQANSASNTATVSSGLNPVAVKVGAVTYYDVNSIVKALHDQAVASGIPNVPAYFFDSHSYSDAASAQKVIDAYYNSIPKSYDVNSQLQKIHDEAVAKGIPNVPDVPKYNSLFTHEEIAQQAITNYLNTIPPTYDVNSAVNSAYNEAIAKGIPAPKPVTDNKVYVDKAQADAAVKSYLDSIPPTYDVNSAMQSAYDSLIKQGVTNVPKPPTDSTVYVDKDKAQAVIDAYTKTLPSVYNVTSSLQAVHDAAVKQGIPNVPSIPKIDTVFTDKDKAQAAVDAYTKTIPTVYNVTASLQAVHDAAVKQGIKDVPDVPKDSTVYVDKDKAQKTIDAYVNKINSTSASQVTSNTVTTYNVNAAMQAVRDDLVKQGFANIPTVPKDTKTYTSEVEANAVLQKYLDQVNATQLLTGFEVVRNQVISGDKAGAIATANKYGGSSTVDPQKTGGGYNFVNELNDRATGRFQEAQKLNPALTEYQWRKQMIDTMGADNADAMFFGDRPDVFSFDNASKGSFGLMTMQTPSQGYIKPEIVGNLYGEKYAQTTNNMVNPKNIVSDATVNSIVSKMTTADALKYLNSSDYKAGLSTQGQITKGTTALHVDSKPIIPQSLAAETIKITADTISHVGQVKVGDGIWKDTAGATANHIGQVQLKDGTWLDDVIKVGNDSTGVTKQQTTTLITNTATQAQIAAAAKNINNVFTLNPDGTASIKVGAKPTEADKIALDNAQYKLMSGTPTKPVTVAFGSSKVTGSYNPLTGSVTDPVARKQYVDAQIQAETNAKVYAEQVKASQILGKDGEIIDRAQKVGAGSIGSTNAITPIFSSAVDKDKFLADSKALYNTLLSTGKTSVSQLNIAQKVTIDALSSQVDKDLSKASLLVQSSRDIEDAAQQRQTLSNKAKVLIASDMSKDDIAKATAYNKAIDQARVDEKAHASPTAKTSLDAKYNKLDKSNIPLTDRIGGIIGVASAETEDEANAKKKTENAYVNDNSSALDKTLSYLIPQSSIKDVDSALGYAGTKLNDADKYISGLISLPDYESLKPSLDAAQMYNPLTGQIILGEKAAGTAYNAFVNTGIGKTALNTKVAGVSAGDLVSGISNVNSGVSKGIENFEKDQYSELKEKPVTFGLENAALYAAGAGSVGSPVVLGLPELHAQEKGKDLYTQVSTMLGNVGSNAEEMIGNAASTGYKVANTDIAKALNYAGDVSIEAAGSPTAPSIAIGKEMKALAANNTPIENASNAIVSHAEWDLGRLTNAAAGTAAFGGEVLAGDIKFLGMVDEKVSPYTKMLPDSKAISPYAENVWNSMPIGLQMDLAEKAIDKASLIAPKVDKSGMLASILGTEKSIISGVKQGGSDFASEQYDYARERPVTTAGILAATYLGGEVLGAGLKGLELASSGGLARTAEFAASKASSGGKIGKLLWGSADKLATTGTKTLPLVTKTGMGVTYADSVIKAEEDAYAKGGVAGATKEGIKQAVEFIVMGKGFQGGEKHLLESSSAARNANEFLSVGKYEPYKAEDVAPKFNRIQIPTSDGKGANKDFTDWKTYGLGFSLGNKPIISGTSEGIFLGSAPAPRKLILKDTSGKVFDEGSTDSGSLISKVIGKAAISHTAGFGADTTNVHDVFGSTLKLGNKILLTKYKEGGIALGAGSAPESLIYSELSGKPLQFKPSNAAEVPFFRATVAKYTTPESVTALESGRNVLSKIYNSGIDESKLPSQFTVTSETIPEKMRGSTLSAIKQYQTSGGDIEIAGSVSTQNQIGGYLGRKPNDLELYSNNDIKAVDAIKNQYKSQGFVEGRDFRQGVDKKGKLIAKIEFPTGEKGEWKTGIESFTGTHSDMGHGIAPTNPVVIDNTKVLSTIEQAGRKYDASNILTGGTKTSEPILSARMAKNLKHTVDFVDISTYKGVEESAPIEKDLVSYVNSVDKQMSTTTNAEYKQAYLEQVRNSANFQFILENQRLPTKAEIALKTDDGIPSLKKSPASGSVKINTGSLSSIPKEISTGETVSNSIDLKTALVGGKPKGTFASFQARTKGQTPHFKKTVAKIGGKVEKEYLDAHLGLAEIANNATKPIITPEAYSANPKSVPPAFKDLTVKAMLVYDKTSWIETAGSVAQKMQDPFMSRSQHDLEIYTTSAPKAVEYLDGIYKAAGYKEGVDYKIDGSKIQFQVPNKDTGKLEWDTGIETFTHGKEASAEDLLTQAKETETDPFSSHSTELPYGYSTRPSMRVPVTASEKGGTPDWIKINNPKKIGELNIMDLREQVIRKVAGSTIFKGGKLEPAHGGRIKDPLDVVTAGVTMAHNGHPDAAGLTVRAVNADYAKYHNNKEFPEFNEKVESDPVFDFIHKNQRIPTTEEYYKLTGEKIPVLGQIISVGSDISGKLVKTGNQVLDDFLNGKSNVIPTGTQAKLPESGSKTSSLVKKNLDALEQMNKNGVSGLVSNGKQPSIGIEKPEITGARTDRQRTMFDANEKRDINKMISGLTEPIKKEIDSKSRFTRKPSEAFSEGSLVSNTSPSGNNPWKGSEKTTVGNTSPRPSSIVSSSASPITSFKSSGSLSSLISSYNSPVTTRKASPSPISKSPASPSPVSSSKSSPSPISKSPASPSPVSSPSISSPSPVNSPSPSPSPVGKSSPSPSPSSTSPSPSPVNSPSPSPSPVNSPSPSPSPVPVSPSPSPYSYREQTDEKKKPRKKNDLQDLIRKTLQVEADKLISTTKVQTFKEAISGDAVNPTAVTRSDYEKTLRATASQAPKNMASKLPLRNATMAQMGGTPNKVQQSAHAQEIKQKQMQRQANPPKVATNQISKEDLNKVSFGVQRKIKASQRATNGKMQMIPANTKPIKTTTTSNSVSKFQDMIVPQKKSMGNMITGKTKGKR